MSELANTAANTVTHAGKTVRIGGASGFWGDSAIATPQLLTVPGLQYLVYDYLAETTMSILARARAKDPALGYATDFVQAAMGPNLAEILRRGVRVVANAGGLNPGACRDALLRVAAQQGLHPRIAVVTGRRAAALCAMVRRRTDRPCRRPRADHRAVVGQCLHRRAMHCPRAGAGRRYRHRRPLRRQRRGGRGAGA
ncbi:protein of unknown function [Cupriavidus taiwanensis]|uniref:Acyclic terpene utilisation N-terminal domain-containing protein n=1 Tax=Cupriavidus taiwanensis TaxID=164546 RepID=A0A9Q7XTS8_9BURK|nr:protein of unknown function [Cupriavidus taiwanensis]